MASRVSASGPSGGRTILGSSSMREDIEITPGLQGTSFFATPGWVRYLACMKPRVYVETTIPSFYHEARTSPDIVARRDWTRQWWDGARHRYELLTSPAVLDELA